MDFRINMVINYDPVGHYMSIVLGVLDERVAKEKQ
jgi:hypothetical protein